MGSGWFSFMTGFINFGVRPSKLSYLGQFATKARISDTSGLGLTSSMVRTQHIARTSVTSLQVAYANWYALITGEVAVTTSTTFKTAIEYPAGTFSTPVTWTVTSGNTDLSPLITMNIPSGAAFWIRTLITSTNYCYRNTTGLDLDTSVGEGFEFAFGGSVTDKTTSGTVGNSNGSAFPGIYPVAIVSHIKTPSIYIFGDSISAGTKDSNVGDTGIIAKSIGPSFGYIQCGLPSDTLASFNASGARRSALAQYCSHVIGEYGVNDISAGGDTAATLEGRYTTAWANSNFSGKKIYQTILTPESISTDSFATVVNQTTKSGFGIGSVRDTVNTWLRTKPSGLTDYFDVSSILDNGGITNTGIYIANGTAFGFTSDGVHPSIAGYALVQSSGIINPALITR